MAYATSKVLYRDNSRLRFKMVGFSHGGPLMVRSVSAILPPVLREIFLGFYRPERLLMEFSKSGASSVSFKRLSSREHPTTLTSEGEYGKGQKLV